MNSLAKFYQDHPRRLRWWLLLTLATTAALALYGQLVNHWLPGVAHLPPLATATVLAIFAAALVCEYLDSSLGMGYGTILTPLLLLAEFAPLDIVPAVLCSELLTGLVAGVWHHRDGNLDLWHDRNARHTLGWLALLSTVGALAAAALAVKLSADWFAIAIVTIVLAMGVMTLATAKRRIRYRPAAMLGIGLVAAFNKGLSGGGYGPLVTSGQMVSGVAPKAAVAITSLAEAFTCLVGISAYLWLKDGQLNWSLVLPLVAGALLSVPMATATVRRLPEAVLRQAVGILTLLLGSVLLFKLIA
ncbi:sulfite exporter TauE/SafE family protein [Thiospirillum jenense]|uniref:Probable membrane transporter protein n=1 Tax=Thiospirillum jenense TaxID=1653858 RepID=A0A839H6L8_9GAMM|nr:sulfite exporter TauE/SafE family protein [Thiospirillum jenense]MBB1125131.1 sulfite exporter TauE/SafE family protein [Thiospirillum jenense]